MIEINTIEPKAPKTIKRKEKEEIIKLFKCKIQEEERQTFLLGNCFLPMHVRQLHLFLYFVLPMYGKMYYFGVNFAN